jgi:hypothetical protein
MNYQDIGGLLSGFRYYDFKQLKVKPFSVADLSSISEAVKHRSIIGMVDIVNSHIDQDVNVLLDCDFYYILFWLKQKSYPDTSVTLNWDCVNYPVHFQDQPKHFVKDPEVEGLNTSMLKMLGMERSPCGRLNTDIVYKVNTKFKEIPSDACLPKGFCFPRIGSLVEGEFIKDLGLYDDLIPSLRWLDYSSLEEAIEYFDYEDTDGTETLDKIAKMRKQFDFSIKVSYNLKCASCGKVYNINKEPDMFGILPLVDSKAVYDMQYNLMSQFKTQTGEETESRKLLYWHSLFVKDRQKQKEQAAKNKAVAGNRRK